MQFLFIAAHAQMDDLEYMHIITETLGAQLLGATLSEQANWT